MAAEVGRKTGDRDYRADGSRGGLLVVIYYESPRARARARGIGWNQFRRGVSTIYARGRYRARFSHDPDVGGDSNAVFIRRCGREIAGS